MPTAAQDQKLSTMSAAGSFRYDINGLRAWAVMAVLLYHFHIPGFQAGFMGVDLFFVISGYLMTQIITHGLATQRFSLWAFYLSRLRRIAPALGVMLLALLGLGWFFLPSADYHQLAQQTAYSLAFISNIYYWLNAGYFDYASQEKWLLHTWTLGVEFQFYILYPLLLWVLWKTQASYQRLRLGIGLLFILSLGLSLGLPNWYSTANFYLLPTRTWEFLAGGLCFLAKPTRSPRLRLVLLLGGLGLGLFALALVNPHHHWPSVWTVLPVIAASSILLAQAQHTPLLRHPLAQWLGNRSYSLYLWHWPVFVALYFVQRQHSLLWVSVGIGLSLLLAELSYRWVETPTRSGLLRRPALTQSLIVGGAGLILGGISFSLLHFSFDSRPPVQLEQQIQRHNHLDPNWERCFVAANATGSPSCVYGKPDVGVIMLGDSHAAATISALGEVATHHQKGALFLGLAACPPLDQVHYPSYIPLPPNQCRDFNDWVNQKLKHYPNIPVVLISRTSDYLHGPNEPERQHEIDRLSIFFTTEYPSRLVPEFQHEFQQVLIQTACRLAKERPVYLVRPLPEFKHSVPTTLFKNRLLQKDTADHPNDVTLPLSEYHARHQRVWEAQDQAAAQCEHVHILNPLPYLCDAHDCYGSENGQPFYFDDDHLNEYGNKRLKPMFESIFKQGVDPHHAPN